MRLSRWSRRFGIPDPARAPSRHPCASMPSVGQLLIEAKGQVPHGQWLLWLKEYCQISVRSAQTYMQIAHLAPDAQRIAHLPLRRAALELQCRDRDARQAAERDESTREWARKHHREGVMHVATDAITPRLIAPSYAIFRLALATLS
jgi:hypothetical protein